MSETMALFLLLVMFILRIGFPLVIVIVAGNMFNRMIDRQQNSLA